MYPGIPEYINSRGRGMYPYLTGSASWYLLTMLTEVFGVRGIRGDIAFAPKLVRAQFDGAGQASVVTLFAGRTLNVVYHNPAHLSYGEYQIGEIKIDGEPVPFQRRANSAILPRQEVARLADHHTHRVDVSLVRPAT
jgi:cellobiose phosphorylase